MPKGEYLAEINRLRGEELRTAQLINYKVLANGCWEWQGGSGQDGYGKLKRHKKTLRAHRVFYEHHKGEVPEGMWVLHECDNPLCVNPAHLWLGTQLDNEQDKDKKKRRPPPALTKYIDHCGQTLTVREWAKFAGVKYEVLRDRVRRGWTMERALIGLRHSAPARLNGSPQVH